MNPRQLNEYLEAGIDISQDLYFPQWPVPPEALLRADRLHQEHNDPEAFFNNLEILE